MRNVGPALLLASLCCIPAFAGAHEPANPHAQRWQQLSHGLNPQLWGSPRIKIRGGGLTDPGAWTDSPAGAEHAHQAIAHPVTERFKVAETWSGQLRHAKRITTLIKDDHTGKIVGEIDLQVGKGDADHEIHLVTPSGKRRIESVEAGLHAFMEGQPGYSAAASEAREHASSVTKWDNSGRNTRVYANGVVKSVQRGDKRALVYQSAQVGLKDPDHAMTLVEPGTREVTLQAGVVLGVPGRAWSPIRGPHDRTPDLHSIGDIDASPAKSVTQMSLFQLPHDAAPGQRFELTTRAADGTMGKVSVVAQP